MKPHIPLLAVLALAAGLHHAHAGGEKVHTLGKDGLTLHGKLLPDSPKVKVTAPGKWVALRAQRFLIQLSAGKKYRIAMNSKAIDSFLILQDQNGKQLAWNDDDGGGGLNALLELDVLKDGPYKVFAASFKGSGAFTVTVVDAGPFTVLEVGMGLQLRGALGKTKSRTYYVKLAANKTYIIDFVSPDFHALDPYLRLLDSSGKRLAVDDNGGEGINARIVYRVETAGIYQISATSLADGRGPFTLTVRERRTGDRTLEQQQQLIQALQLDARATQMSRQGQYDKAEPHFRQAAAIIKAVQGEKHPVYATMLNNLAVLYLEQRDFSRALPPFRQALAIRKETLGERHPAYAASLNNLAGVYAKLGDQARAEPLYRQALAVFKESGGKKHPLYAIGLNNLGALYKEQGEFTRAKLLFEEALAVRKEVLGNRNADYVNYGVSLGNLAAVCLDLAEYARAESLFRQALAIHKKALGEQHPFFAATLNNLAEVYRQQGDYAKAEPLYRQALALKKAGLAEKTPHYAATLNNLALLHQANGAFARAEPLFLESLAIRKKTLGTKHPDYATSLNSLAALYGAQGDYAKAVPLMRQALNVLQTTDVVVPFDRLDADHLRIHPHTVLYLENHAILLQRLAFKNPTAERLRACDRAFALALAVLERVRQHGLDEEASKILLTGEYFDSFPERIRVLARLFALERKSQDLEAAFQTAEQGTARAFLEALGKARANVLAGVAPSVQTDEQELLQQMRQLDVRIEQESARPRDTRDPKLVRQLLGQRDDAEVKLKQLVARMEKQHPQYAALKYPRPCTLQQARACLAADEVALLFVPGTDASSLVLLEARPRPDDQANGLAIIELPGAATLAESIAGLIDADTLALPARTHILGRQAFDAILGPCTDRIKNKSLVIVPNGALCFLPFELLVDDDGKHLVEKHRIRYAPSLTALHLIELWKQKRAKPQLPLFAVGDPVYGKSFPRLEHSGFEVAEIARTLGARDECVLTRARASKAEIKRLSDNSTLARARYFHFATHGILGLDRGTQPALVLAQSGNDPAASFLRMDEITALKLNADLVVLSACKSGQGRLHQGEGVTGLARAFLYAGSKGVVCSLWSVDDRETANLMVDFYSHLQKGRSAPDALRDAQLAMIRAGKAPIYWAPFILIGE